MEDINERKVIEADLLSKTDELARRAHEDHLTGLANRRHFDDVLSREMERARRSTLPLGLILIDIDQFKRYNDTWGHVAGDQCLRAVADAIKSVVRRPGDLPARFGGEEFAIILPDTSSAGCLEVAAAALTSVAKLELGNYKASRTVTISAGVATFQSRGGSSHGPDCLVLVETADSALYRSKADGRNRVSLAPNLDSDLQA